MKEYYLFLDESKPNANFMNFTLGGVIVEKQDYENNIKPLVNRLKKECFGNEEVILHEIDIRKKEGDFIGITKIQQETFFRNLNDLFIKQDSISVMAVSINIDDLDKIYRVEDRNDIYYISLQLIMENFVQFLSCHDGIGIIYLETTDNFNNTKLQNLFHLK